MRKIKKKNARKSVFCQRRNVSQFELAQNKNIIREMNRCFVDFIQLASLCVVCMETVNSDRNAKHFYACRKRENEKKTNE